MAELRGPNGLRAQVEDLTIAAHHLAEYVDAAGDSDLAAALLEAEEILYKALRKETHG